MSEREEFEKWCDISLSQYEYDKFASAAWLCWQAARAPLLERITALEAKCALLAASWKKAEDRVVELEVAARQASFCLRELLPNDPDAKFTVKMLSDAIEPKTSR
jgi:hypothetical protein